MGVILPSMIAFAAAYLAGSVPFGYLIGRVGFKIDVREHGSRNPGATNVWRTLGAKAGLSTLLLDAAKGAVPVVIAQRVMPAIEPAAVAAGVGAIVGHNWSVFLLGKGGKGVATSAGAFFALMPVQMGVALAAFLAVFLTTRTVSAGSIGAALAFMTAALILPTSPFLRGVAVFAAILIVIRHRANIRRLVNGEEPKVPLGRRHAAR